MAQIGVVIASRGDAQLLPTIQSILVAAPGARIVLVDDTDKGGAGLPDLRPVDGAFEVVTHPSRLGCARARFLGGQYILNSGTAPDVTFFVDDHMAFHPDDPRTDPQWRQAAVCPTAAPFAPVAATAMACGGIAYAGCNLHHSATVTVQANVHNVYRCQWDRDYQTPTATRGMMGAFYGATSKALDRMGGWPALPGWIGWDEEAVSILCARIGIPIMYVPGVQTWHDFAGAGVRNSGYKYSRYLVNLAAVYRLFFHDEAWAMWRRMLGTGLLLECTRLAVPEAVLREVETPDMLAYGESLRARFKDSDADFMAAWGWPT